MTNTSKGTRIAVCGAHGTGKTTLIRALKDALSPSFEVKIIAGISRGVIARGFPMGKLATVDSYANYIRDQLRAEREAVTTVGEILLSDRSILDALAYARVNAALPGPSVPEYFIEMLHEVWKVEERSYDAIVYLPIEFPMEPDGVREVDEPYRIAVSDTMAAIARASDLQSIRAVGSLGERLDQVIGLIREGQLVQTRSKCDAESVPLRVSQPISGISVDFGAKDPLVAYKDVTTSTALTRLGGVSFLGLMDQVYQLSHPTDRLEHTLGVTRVCLEMGARLRLDPETMEVWTIGNLLHDVGHAPFSHNSEPFLLETKRVYHTGVLSLTLRGEADTLGFGVNAALANRSDSVKQRVRALLSRSGNEPLLEQIFFSPINADKLDGNIRTANMLGVAHSCSPEAIIDSMEMRDGRVFVRAASLSILRDFWELEKSLYWDLIYTDAVFGAEAILTRALHTAYSSAHDVASFLTSDDRTVLERLSTNPATASYVEVLMGNAPPLSLRLTAPDVFAEYSESLREVRFKQAARRTIETAIAIRMNVSPDRVISHFSRRKRFVGDVQVMAQASLFHEGEDLIPLEDVDSALKRTKVSGDMFDVYITPN